MPRLPTDVTRFISDTFTIVVVLATLRPLLYIISVGKQHHNNQSEFEVLGKYCGINSWHAP